MDPRVARTRAALIHAVLEMIGERPLGEISVAGVCARAGISRVTFYERFGGRDELLVAAMESSLAHVSEAAAGIPVPNPRPDDVPPADLIEVFRRVGAHAPLYRAMLGDGGSLPFLLQMRAALGTAVIESLRRVPGDPAAWPVSPSAYVDYVTGATVSVIMGWLEREGDSVPPERIAEEFWWLLTRRPEHLAAAGAGA